MADDTRLPLAGIRVLDCSRVYAGPIASMLLGDLGAEVWKLEPPAGDETRGWGPPWWGPVDERRSTYFASVNRNKRSLMVDLRTDGGRIVLDRLARVSDVLLHNYLPSVAARLGVDDATLRAVHPHLVVSRVSGFPGTGALAERPAYDLVAQAMSGHMTVTGDPGGEPMKIGVALLDLTAGLQAAIGALAGLVARERRRDEPATGPAAQASVSLIEAGVAALTNVLGAYLATGHEPGRWGTGHADIVPYQAFAARDGHLVVAVGNDAQFTRLVDVLGIAPRDEWTTNSQRLAARDPVIDALTERIRERGRDELVAALTAADVPCGPVNGVAEAVALMRSVDPAWVTEVEGIGVPAAPLRIDGERLPLRLAPPRPGEHTDAILSEVGFSPAEIAELRAAGAVS